MSSNLNLIEFESLIQYKATHRYKILNLIIIIKLMKFKNWVK